METTPGQPAMALVCESLSDDLGGVAVRTVTPAEPGPGQVSVAVGAAALNYPDLLMTRGGYQHRPSLPFVIGMEGCGRIVGIGPEVSERWRLGQRVVFAGKTGACATRTVVDADALVAAPQAFDDAQAAAYPVGATTAYASLCERARLRPGDWLVVHGASGGMGMAAVQLGVRLGARVIATSRMADAPERLARLGAVEWLSPDKGWHERVKAITEGRGADIVFDPVGGDVFDDSMHALRWGGSLLIVGFTSGRVARMPTNLALIKSLTVMGVRAGEMGRRDARLGARIERAIWALAEDPAMAPEIGARFPLEQGLEAMRALQERRFAGKIAVQMH